MAHKVKFLGRQLRMRKLQVTPGPKLEYYDVKAAASFLMIGTSTIYKAIQRRELRHVRLGKSVRISHADLEKWIWENSPPTVAEIKCGIASKKTRRGTMLSEPGNARYL